jgi:hypothetical protein
MSNDGGLRSVFGGVASIVQARQIGSVFGKAHLDCTLRQIGARYGEGSIAVSCTSELIVSK